MRKTNYDMRKHKFIMILWVIMTFLALMPFVLPGYLGFGGSI